MEKKALTNNYIYILKGAGFSDKNINYFFNSERGHNNIANEKLTKKLLQKSR
jgi:hypothetical protein